jgi:hypothetical protein
MVTAVSLMTLPFMQSLTVGAGFPLKIYEVLIIGSFPLFLLYGRLIFPQSAVPMARATFLWMLLVSMLLVFKLSFPPPTMSEIGIDSRFGAAGDGITKLIYLWLNLYAFLLFASQARRDEHFFISCWLWGSMLAASYEFYLIAANLAGVVDPPMLPNSKPVLFGLGSHLFLRAATFTEGNYAGLYFVTSMLLALHARRKRVAGILAVATVTSFSTPALIVLGLIGAMYIWDYFCTRRAVIKFFLAPMLALSVLVVGAGLATTTFVQTTVLDKLFAGNNTGEALSRVERLADAQAAWQMFLDNPLTGVGVAQFGYNVQHYAPSSVAGKQIPNVVYLEFLSEDGLVVFLIFMYSMWVIFRRTSATGEGYLRLGLISFLLYFVAFPTISVMYVWAFFGLIAGRLRGAVGVPIRAS